SVLPTPASPSRKSGFWSFKLKYTTVARLRSATYIRSRRARSTSSIDAGACTGTPDAAETTLSSHLCFDFVFHTAKKLIHHRPGGRQQHPLANSGDHPADLAVAVDDHVRPAL